jgi:hypothetical protein
MTAKPSAIARTFRDLSDKEVADAEKASFLARWGWSGNLGWDELLKSRRILIMSEAGVGKTHGLSEAKPNNVPNDIPTFRVTSATSCGARSQALGWKAKHCMPARRND